MTPEQPLAESENAAQSVEEQARHARIEVIKNELGAETLESAADSFKQIYETVQLRLGGIAESPATPQEKEAEANLLLDTWRRFSNAVFAGNSEQAQSDIGLIEKSAHLAREGLQQDTATADLLKTREEKTATS